MKNLSLALSLLTCFNLCATETNKQNQISWAGHCWNQLNQAYENLPSTNNVLLKTYIAAGTFLLLANTALGATQGRVHDGEHEVCDCQIWRDPNNTLSPCARWICDIHYVCFSKNMTVNVLPQRKAPYTKAEIQDYLDYEQYQTIKIADVQLGHYVQTGPEDFEQVFSFAHRDPKLKAKFKQIKTKDGLIELSDFHLIHVKRDNKTREVEVFAKDVRLTDKLNINNIWQKVTEINDMTDVGVYSPIPNGLHILVNGVLASPYSTVNSSKIAQLAYTGRKLNFKLHGAKEIHPDDIIDAHPIEKRLVRALQKLAPRLFVTKY